MSNVNPYFEHRSYYVNFAEHLQNAWNVNMLYPNAPNQWSMEDWKKFLTMVKAFNFNCFEYWLVPTLYDKPALEGNALQKNFAAAMRQVNDIAHDLGIKTKFICGPSCMGPDWRFLCPNDPEEHKLIVDLWTHWANELAGTDIVGIFPGDPGGCNRNGCTHETFVDVALEISQIVKAANPAAVCEIGTWGTPFSGWGSDLRDTPNWDGSWAMLIDEQNNTPEVPCHIWNGTPARAKEAMEYLIKRLPDFADDTMVAINTGFDFDAGASMGGDARGWAREVAKTNKINSWDYSVCEGELINYPHWRLPRMSTKRRQERSAAPYSGGMAYTMTPILSQLSMYAAGQLFTNPDTDPDQVSSEFCAKVFGEEHKILGELFEAFEVVKGWGYYPRTQYSKEVLQEQYGLIVDHLKAADMSKCSLPIFPDPETYRNDLIWFAEKFKEMAGPNPDREKIRKEYWQKSLAIYDSIRMSADERAELAAKQFSDILT